MFLDLSICVVTKSNIIQFAAQLVPLNEHIGPEGKSCNALILGFFRSADATNWVIVLVSKDPLHVVDSHNIGEFIYACCLTDFISCYISDWLVDCVYDNKFQTYEPVYIGAVEVR